jgi:YVTN family beta-propeller protein
MKKLAAVAVLVWLGSLLTTAQPVPPFTLQRVIPLPEVTGKFDHFAVDLAGKRLFVAATGNHSVEVIDLTTDKVKQSISGLGKPHGLVWVPDTGSLYVADGTLGDLKVYHGSPLALAGTIKLSADADDMVFDSATRVLYVGHGGGADPAKIAVIDTGKFALIADLTVATHPEALDLDARGQRVFANIADSSEVAVIDTAAHAIGAHWKLTDVADNVPLVYDSEHGDLYIACRTPAILMALDGVSGAEISRVPTGGQADDLFYDSALHRVYVISGAGEVDAYQVDSGKKLQPLGVTYTEPGAKTGLFVPSQNMLYVGIPGTNDSPAHISVYSTQSRGSK